MSNLKKKNGNGSPRVALITGGIGGIGGIGTEVCKFLQRQGRFIVAGFHPDEYQIAKKWQETIESEGFKFELVPGDVFDFDSSKSMVEEVVNRFGSVDILVNCRGYYPGQNAA